MIAASSPHVPTGIAPLDDRIGGFEPGGRYLVVGAPGPAKMVTALQFLHAGVARGEPGLLITSATADSILEVAAAWGLPMRSQWADGTLQIVGFRDDFDLRAIRSIAPEEVLEELDEIVEGEPMRIAVDPGTMFLTGGARTLLGSTFLSWCRKRTGTMLATFSIDGDANALPSSADWLLNATTARLVITRQSDSLFHLAFARSLPGVDAAEVAVSVELRAGEGLVRPSESPTRRGADRAGVDRNRLLLVSVEASHALDLEAWAKRAFDSDVVSAPFEAVARVQEADYGCVLIHAPRRKVREAVQACRAIRPLTRAAIVFASDDAIRSTDRIQVLEAGADDCLSGGLDFRELGLRIRQAIAAGAKPTIRERPALAIVRPPDDAADGRVSRDVLHLEIDRRAKDPNSAFFCLLDVGCSSLTSEKLESGVAELVRSEDGDLVSGGNRCLVLLQGAREGQIGAFVRRMETHVQGLVDPGADPRLEVGVHSHPADALEIEELLESHVVEAD